MEFIRLYIEHQSRKDYIIQEHVEFKQQYFSENELGNFYRYTSKSIYIETNFHASDELHQGPELSYNYIIN